MQEERDLDRIRRALAGEPGLPCVGVTFLPDEAVLSLSWGASHQVPLVSVVCSRLRPDFAFVRSWDPGAGEICAEVARCGTAPLWVVRGAFDTVAAAQGWSETLRATISEPEALAGALDDAVRVARATVREGIECGAVGVVVGEDVAGAEGPLLSPDYILSEIVPRVGRIAAAATEEGSPAVWHSDGDVRPFLAAAARAGLDAVHPGGLPADQLGEVFLAARREGLALLGGIPADVLREGGPAVIRAGVAAGVAAYGGGLLVSDDGGVTTGEELGMLVMALQSARSAGPEDGS